MLIFFTANVDLSSAFFSLLCKQSLEKKLNEPIFPNLTKMILQL